MRAALALAITTLMPGLALAQRLGGGSDPTPSFGRVLAALLASLIVAGVAILLIRKRQGRGAPLLARWAGPRSTSQAKVLEVVETRRLSQHADICLVRFRGAETLLAISTNQLLVIDRTEPEPGRGP